MNKKLIITESQLKRVKSHIIESEFHPKLVERLKADLDKNYEPIAGVERKSGEYYEKPMIKIKVDGDVITPKALFEYFLKKYKLGEEFIKQVIKDWVFGKIEDNKLTKNVSISENGNGKSKR
jgi:hypothetical protein